MAILISLQIPLLTQSGLPEAVDDAEAYAVYASILPHDWIVVDAHATSLVIRKETVTNWSCMPSGRQFEAEWRPVIDSLRRENRSVRTLRPLFHLGLPYTLVATSELNALFQAPGYSWADFHRRFPGSGGYIELSAVGFDDSKARAIVYLAHHCGPECARGTHHVLEKIDGAWRAAPAAHVPGMIQCETSSEEIPAVERSARFIAWRADHHPYGSPAESSPGSL